MTCDMNVRTILRRSATFHREHVAVVADGRQLTFQEAWSRGLRLANGLTEYGLAPQDAVGVLETNGLPALDFYLGAAAANFIRVPLYVRNARRAHVTMLNNTRAKVLVVDEKHLAEVEGIQDDVPTLERIVVRDTSYESWLESQSANDPDLDIADTDLFVIRHTGGTEGIPKAVAISHDTWAATGRDWFYPLPPPQLGDPLLHVGPLSHASGYTLLPVWAAGGVQVPVADLTPEQLVAVMERERIAYAFLPPALLNMLTRVPGVEKRDWSHAKCFFTGSAPISEETIERSRRAFGDRLLYQLFGQTEAVPVAGMGPNEWFAEVEGSTPTRACGRVLPWVDIEIRDEENRPLPLGENGEIAVRCAGAFDGFYDAPEETARRLVDGWVLMGDMGRIDENGYLYLVDRKNDMIVSGGFNIYPGELENAIASHPAVIEVAVFGIPHEKWGETPMAVCMVDPDVSVTEEEIVELVAEELGSYMKPGKVEFTTEPLPKTPVGKIVRRVLREPHWADHEARVAGA
jgi:acyl-CoA synthetase (AMP-forming)/AMP-acid ligase II